MPDSIRIPIKSSFESSKNDSNYRVALVENTAARRVECS
jgi:hypothetical protein